MDELIKKKLRVVAIATSVLVLVIISIFGREYLNEKRKNRALKHFHEIAVTVMLADTPGMDLECSDNRGNAWIIDGNNKSLLDIVSQDIDDYISGEKQSLYSYKIIEPEDMQRYLDNFNDNMQHIRISGEDGAGDPIPPKTISEGAGMEEFQEIKDLEELIIYMHKVTKYGQYYLHALAVIGLDGSGFNGRITYDMGDGTENIIHDNGTISIRGLFSIPYRDYEYKRGVKSGDGYRN